MTAAEFARKHGIPYQDVRQALRLTPTRQKESWALEFPEDELRQALLKRMEDVRAFHRERAEHADAVIRALKGGVSHEPDAGG